MIRKANENDLKKILEIFNYAVIHTTAIYDYAPHSLEQQKNWYHEKNRLGFPILVYEENDKVFGYATYGSFRPHLAYKYTIEHSIYVHHLYQNIGIGKSLLNELIVHASKEKYRSMIGVIDSQNLKSINLHKHYDFKKVGLIKNCGYKFDRWLDVVFLQLELI